MDCCLLASPVHASQNTGVGSHSLLQGIILTQRSNPCIAGVSCIAGKFFTIWDYLYLPKLFTTATSLKRWFGAKAFQCLCSQDVQKLGNHGLLSTTYKVKSDFPQPLTWGIWQVGISIIDVLYKFILLDKSYRCWLHQFLSNQLTNNTPLWSSKTQVPGIVFQTSSQLPCLLLQTPEDNQTSEECFQHAS